MNEKSKVRFFRSWNLPKTNNKHPCKTIGCKTLVSFRFDYCVACSGCISAPLIVSKSKRCIVQTNKNDISKRTGYDCVDLSVLENAKSKKTNRRIPTFKDWVAVLVIVNGKVDREKTIASLDEYLNENK